MELKNKIAVITGGTHGIGAATALKLAEQGASIALIARNNIDVALKSRIEGYGVSCLSLTADLSTEEECQRVIQEVYEKLGGIDILVHSAGSAAPGGLLNGAREKWYQAFDIHIHALFHLCRAAVPIMKEKNAVQLL